MSSIERAFLTSGEKYERLAFTFCKRTPAGQVPATQLIPLERRRGAAR